MIKDNNSISISQRFHSFHKELENLKPGAFLWVDGETIDAYFYNYHNPQKGETMNTEKNKFLQLISKDFYYTESIEPCHHFLFTKGLVY